MNKQELKKARVALREFHSASLEVDFSSAQGKHGKAASALSRAEDILMAQSKLAIVVHRQIINTIEGLRGFRLITDSRSYYVENRQRMADSILDGLLETATD